MLNTLKRLLALTLFFFLLLGVAYPALVTGIASLAFSEKAEGSLIRQDTLILASPLIGQNFIDPSYFQGRPSATGEYPTNGLSSGAANIPIASPLTKDLFSKRIAAAQTLDETTAPVPFDRIATSASGLDPHISPENALQQIPRIASKRNLSPDALRALVQKHTEAPQFGVLGLPRVNIVRLNLELDGRL